MNGKRRLLVIGAVALAAIAVAPASAQTGRIVGLLVPLPGDPIAEVEDINASGVAVGASYKSGHTDRRPVRWAPNGDVTELGLPPGQTTGFATGITTSGTVVGGSGDRPVRWAPDGTITELPLPADEVTCWARAAHDTGGVVGTCSWTENTYLWAPDGQVIRLAPLPGDVRARVTDVNANGTAVGWSEVDNFLRYPVKWDRYGTVSRLGGLPGQAFGINDKGEVAGQVNISDGLPPHGNKQYAVRWTEYGTMTNLGAAPGSTTPLASGAGINEDGTVVGNVVTDDRRQLGARWSVNGTFSELHPINPPDPDESTMAEAISDNGVVVGRSAGKAVRWTGYR
ncbi:hypothetical protein [Kibdelosporangium aridum]|uniref:hypothetical protein n=1 Tax=Kibdelosporangium aridum TaxID=2030 RepID=UPI0005243248